MKGILAHRLAVVVLMALISTALVGQSTIGKSDADPSKCSVATLKGTYLVSAISYVVNSTPTVQAYIAVAARTIYNGDGTSTNFARFTINGGSLIDSTSPGIYTVDADCKGTETHIDPVTAFHHEYVTIISPDGNEVHVVAIDSGVVQALVARRVER